MVSKRVATPIVGLLLLAVLAGCVTNPSSSATGAVKTTCGTNTAASFGSVNLAGTVGRSSVLTASAPHAPIDAAPTLSVSAPAMQVDQSLPAALKIGTLLPLTGGLKDYGPEMQAAAHLAVSDINAAGGVNGMQIQVVDEDETDSPTSAAAGFSHLASEGVDAVIGPAASPDVAAVLNTSVQDKIMDVTPSATNPGLTLPPQNNHGYFLRMPPSDALQGKVLAQLVWSEGCHSASTVYLNQAYGIGLEATFAAKFKALGGTIDKEVAVSTTDAPYTSQIQSAASSNPDAIVVIAYSNNPGAGLLRTAYSQGVMSTSTLYMSEGMKDDGLAAQVGNQSSGGYILSGIKGTTPSSVSTNATTAFLWHFHNVTHETNDLFAAQTYDAVFAVALAAQCAGSNTADAIKSEILNVTNGQTGATEVYGVNGTAQAVLAAKACALHPIHYNAASGNLQRDSTGDPTSGVYAYWEFNSTGVTKIYKDGILVTPSS
ncbi:MAG: ABC transporter substrate-binding protein [Thermoplasmatota archaeon]